MTFKFVSIIQMQLLNKVVITIPLENIWTDNQMLLAKRATYLTSEDITQLLQKSAMQFVVAEVGFKLQWIAKEACFGFWKVEVKQHLANNADKIDLEVFTNNYAYVASLWTMENEASCIVLERFH